MKELIKRTIDKGLETYEYNAFFHTMASLGKTSGPKQSEELINYTKLNFTRSKRVHRTIDILPELKSKVRSINKYQTWILLTETWCGDAANNVPVIQKVSQLSDWIELKVVFRDQNLELMDRFLTNGGRSIPKLIVLDQNYNTLFDWGPRPEAAQEIYQDWKNSDNPIPYQDFHIELQKWYNDDRGKSLQEELYLKLEGIGAEKMAIA